MASLDKFLKEIGVPSDMLEKLQSDEPPEDFDVSTAVDRYRNAQKTVYRKMLKPELDDKYQTHIARFYGQFKEKLRNTLDLDELGVELGEEEHVVDALGNIKSAIDKKLSEKYDDEKAKKLQGKVSNLTSQIKEYEQKYKGLEEKYQSDIEKLENEKNQIRRTIELDRLFESLYAGVNWGIPETQVPVWKRNLRNEITSNWAVAPDGSMKDPEGGDALNFEGNGVYEHVRQPLEFLLKKYDLERKSQGGGEGGDPPPRAIGRGAPPKIETGKRYNRKEGFSEEANALAARIERARRKK